ncbi:MAG TPA: antitoxin family protein [Vicinamibacteria bacterium]|nr:antitoxin family protein [Vicinamibacteria bacterium]
MTTAVKAIYEHGVFRRMEPVHLKEATEVEVLVPADSPGDDDDATGWKACASSSVWPRTPRQPPRP